MTCKICGTAAEPIMQGVVLNKHPVGYHRCPRCGFVQTDEPHWLAEAYAQPINRSDVGYVQRNVSLAQVTSSVLATWFPQHGACVDFGGGYGMFVRLMRDLGHAFYRLDRYCPNLFAVDFEAAESGTRYSLLTAFEVFEHLDQPIREIESMLALSDNLLFSTVLIAESHPPLDQWSYYGLEHGQHVAFYSARTLQYLAERYGLHLRTWPGGTLHLLTRTKIPDWSWFLFSRERVRWLAGKLRHARPSLLMEDYRTVVAKIKDEVV